MTDDGRDRPVPNPFTGALTVQREATRSVADALRKSTVAGDRAAAMASVEVGETPSEVVYTENKLELLHYESLTEQQHDVPILVVYALINKPFILDLQPDRSVVRRLLEAGHDVYLIDWGEPSRLDASLGLYDYVERYLDNCVDVVRERSGQDAINLLGYCMGGTFSTIYAALHPEKVRALGLMATGLYFDDSGGVLERWGDEEHYDPRDVMDAFGNVPAEYLAVGFALMDPVANYLTKYVHLYDDLENEDFVRNFARMERWLSDGVDVAGEAYAEFVEDLYQDNLLYRNELELGGQRVDVRNVDMPVLQIVGTYDHLVPNEASLAFNDVIPADVTVVEYPTGHVGLSMSASVHRAVWPEVAEWFLEHSGAPSLADVVGEGIEESLGYDVETDVTVGGPREVEIRIADGSRELARGVVERDPRAVLSFVEDALGVGVWVEQDEEGFLVGVRYDDGVETTHVERVGVAISEEVREAIEDRDVAARIELEDVGGIGPSYAGRLRRAGIGSVPLLATADPGRVADVADATHKQAREWIASARDLTGSGERAAADEGDDAVGGGEGSAPPRPEAVEGIGPTDAERLRQAGIRTLADLAAADAGAVARAAAVSETRAEDWIDRAREIRV